MPEHFKSAFSGSVGRCDSDEEIQFSHSDYIGLVKRIQKLAAAVVHDDIRQNVFRITIPAGNIVSLKRMRRGNKCNTIEVIYSKSWGPRGSKINSSISVRTHDAHGGFVLARAEPGSKKEILLSHDSDTCQLNSATCNKALFEIMKTLDELLSKPSSVPVEVNKMVAAPAA